MRKNQKTESQNPANQAAIQHRRTVLLALTGMFAALITLLTAYFIHIPFGANGGYIHFGDAMIYVAAALLPTPYAMIAGAIGGGLADLLTAPLWAPATLIIKMLITLPFTSKKGKMLCRRNLIAPVIAFVISGIGYFLAEGILFGALPGFIVSIFGSVAQSGGSAIFFYVFAAALDRMHIKERLAEQISGGAGIARTGEQV